MTGTAATESTEFESIYKLKVTIVPTNKPMIRKVCLYESSTYKIPKVLLLIIVDSTTGPGNEERSKEIK